MPRFCAGRTVASRRPPCIPFRIIRRPALLPALFLCLASAAAHGQGIDARIGAGIDVIHDVGTPMFSASASFASLLAWRRTTSGDNFGMGLAFPLGNPEGLNFGLGAFAVYKTDELLGTHLNFLARASYCGKNLCLSAVHLSHGRIFGLDEDAANKGLNFVFLEYRLK
jgi:hypothetical protein